MFPVTSESFPFAVVVSVECARMVSLFKTEAEAVAAFPVECEVWAAVAKSVSLVAFRPELGGEVGEKYWFPEVAA